MDETDLKNLFGHDESYENTKQDMSQYFVWHLNIFDARLQINSKYDPADNDLIRQANKKILKMMKSLSTKRCTEKSRSKIAPRPKGGSKSSLVFDRSKMPTTK